MAVIEKRFRAIFWGSLAAAFFLFAGRGASQTLDEVYKLALKEGGILNCYCSLAQINAQKIYPVF